MSKDKRRSMYKLPARLRQVTGEIVAYSCTVL